MLTAAPRVTRPLRPKVILGCHVSFIARNRTRHKLRTIHSGGRPGMEKVSFFWIQALFIEELSMEELEFMLLENSSEKEPRFLSEGTFTTLPFGGGGN